jgi:myxalamid-type polyketide synthase MxaD
MHSGRWSPSLRRKLVFVFSGQGSQWVGMGRELLEQEPAFREAMERCDRAIRKYTGWSVLEELAADEARSRLEEVDVVQPAIFAVQVSLANLWLSWGIEPDAVVGQSLGEVAAAYVAGALTLEDAARVMCRRSQLVKKTSGQGSMAVVQLPLVEAKRAISGREDRVSVAVNSSPTLPCSRGRWRRSKRSWPNSSVGTFSSAASGWSTPLTARRWTPCVPTCSRPWKVYAPGPHPSPSTRR